MILDPAQEFLSQSYYYCHGFSFICTNFDFILFFMPPHWLIVPRGRKQVNVHGSSVTLLPPSITADVPELGA
jgi:hypothetical protein